MTTPAARKDSLPMRLLRPFLAERFLKFASVGLSGVLVNMGSLALLQLGGLQINVASAVSIELSILSNFVINQFWTFRDRRGGGESVWRHAFRFHLVSLGGAVIQSAIFIGMNVVWLFLLGSESARTAFLTAGADWSHRWLWRPIVNPPRVGNWVYVSQLLGIGAATVWNYLLNFYWTWSERGRKSAGGSGAAAQAGSGRAVAEGGLDRRVG